jgi:hypothetical protein
MTDFDQFRTEIDKFRRTAEDEASYLKEPFVVLERLSELYRSLDERYRAAADGIFSDWLLSDDESRRFDAIALIRRFEVRSAVPRLRELADRLATRSGPGPKFERQKVEKLIDVLTAADTLHGQTE